MTAGDSGKIAFVLPILWGETMNVKLVCCKVCTIALVVLLGIASSARAQIASVPQDSTFHKTMFLRGALGYSFGASNDLNDILQEISESFSLWDSFTRVLLYLHVAMDSPNDFPLY